MVVEGDKMGSKPEDSTKPLLVLGYNFGTNSQARIIGTKVVLFTQLEHAEYLAREASRHDSVDLDPIGFGQDLRSGVDSKSVLPIFSSPRRTDSAFEENLLELKGAVLGEAAVPHSNQLKVFLVRVGELNKADTSNPDTHSALRKDLYIPRVEYILAAIADVVRGMVR